VPAASPKVPSWEELYRAASPQQQQELLLLAQRQGLLYTHQLPPMLNGSQAEPDRPLLARLLRGQVAGLEPLRPVPLEMHDQALDEIQREAVCRAVQTPDVCLIEGLPGTGKSRVAAEIIRQAIHRKERVLLLAPAPAALDRVLESVASDEGVFALRCLDRDERLESLSPPMRGLTFAERARWLHEQPLAGARAEVKAANHFAEQLEKDKPIWDRLGELTGSLVRLGEQRDALRQNRSCLAVGAEEFVAEAERGEEADAFRAAMQANARQHQEALPGFDEAALSLGSQIEGQQAELKRLGGQLAALRPLVEAKRRGRWWTSAWWQARRQEDRLEGFAELERREQKLQGDLDALRAQVHELQERRAQVDQAYHTQRANLIEAERERRAAQIGEREHALAVELGQLERDWDVACSQLTPDTACPSARTAEAVAAARAAWADQFGQAKERQQFVREWIEYLETAGALPQRLPELANLVAATTTALRNDPHFGDTAQNGTGHPPFDLLVLEEAEQVTESELLNAVRRARRWVLLGEPVWEREVAAPVARGRVTMPVLPRVHVFERLWHHLHCDPRRLPYTWFSEADRLGCRLRSVPDDLRSLLETERVADHPDIELRILTPPRGQPVLAAIVFPPSMTLEQAKQYIFQELEELAVQPTAGSLCWVEEPERLVLRLAEQELAHERSVLLSAGVCETLGPVDNDGHGGQAVPQTCCLEFDRTAGWHRPRAEAWIEQYLGLRDLGRTIRLRTLHRMRPDLGAFLTHCLSSRPAGAAPVDNRRNGQGAAVEFVAVPPSRGERDRNRGGAGLEIDLSDARHRDRLPSELRPHLTARGLVNYLEAQAVVRALVTLNQLASDVQSVAVLALYPAQAELIRLLIRQTPELASPRFTLVIDVPAALRQREVDVVLVSLTRSHSHRAVAFGDGPQALRLAFSRACRRLVFFGDPGTLQRRNQWDGPLDHLSEAAAAHERDLLRHLLRYFPAHYSPPCASSLHQSHGP
jgi:hypothetical protein